MGVVHVVVVGCGRVGSELAIQLSDEGHEVVIIDRNPDSFRRLVRFHGRQITGSGFDRETLRTAEASRADALAAVTSGDNTNILCARIARDHFNIKNVVARIYDPNRAFIYQKLGIPTVATSSWTTTQVKRWMVPSATPPEWASSVGGLQLVERVVPDHLAGKPLSGFAASANVRLVGLIRGGLGRLDVENLFAQEDDVLEFLVSADGLDELNEFLGGKA